METFPIILSTALAIVTATDTRCSVPSLMLLLLLMKMMMMVMSPL